MCIKRPCALCRVRGPERLHRYWYVNRVAIQSNHESNIARSDAISSACRSLCLCLSLHVLRVCLWVSTTLFTCYACYQGRDTKGRTCLERKLPTMFVRFALPASCNARTQASARRAAAPHQTSTGTAVSSSTRPARHEPRHTHTGPGRSPSNGRPV